MKKIFYIILLFIFCSCVNKKETIKGELYFKLVSFWPNDGSAGKSINIYLKKIENSNNPSDKKVFTYYNNLKKYNMLSAPSIKLKTEGYVKEIFLTQKEYLKLKNFKLEDLNAKGKKIVIVLDVEKLDSTILFSDKILSITEVDGKSSWSK